MARRPIGGRYSLRCHTAGQAGGDVEIPPSAKPDAVAVRNDQIIALSKKERPCRVPLGNQLFPGLGTSTKGVRATC